MSRCCDSSHSISSNLNFSVQRVANQLQLSCPAKINLALSVGSLTTTPDGQAMHPIASWMIGVNLSDHLQLTRLTDNHANQSSQFTIAFDDELDRQVDWPLERDLAFRAHALLESHVNRKLAVNAIITKRIPPGGGLGGGSSDAAGMFFGLNQLFELNLSRDTLDQLATSLGSDIPFLIHVLAGQTSAIATGLGSTLQPAPRHDLIPIVLAFPPFGCSTGPVYQAFDQLQTERSESSSPTGVDLPRVQQQVTAEPLPPDAPFNDLELPACRVEPRLGELLKQLRDAGLAMHVTGSGSTLFLIAPSAITANVLARKITAIAGIPAIATRTLAQRGD